MKAEIIKIGNSKGIRIPKTILMQCKLDKAVNIEIKNNELVITPHQEARENWGYEFKQMATNNNDMLLDEDIVDHSWDKEEWLW